MRARIVVFSVLLLLGIGCDGAEDLNRPPSVGFAYTPASPSVGTPVEFSAEATDPDGHVESFAWDFGDGGEASGSAPSYTFDESGSYDVTVTVTDDGSRTDSDTKTVEVEE